MPKRKVKIDDNTQPQQWNRGYSSVMVADRPQDELGPVKPRGKGPICVPTGDRRHATAVREGRLSFEVFARANREMIPVDPDIQEGGGKADNASQKQKAAKVGVRGQGGEVGTEAPLQSADKEKVNAQAARRRKTKKVKGD